jgi:xylulokinase
MLCGLADGVDALVRQGIEPRRVLLIGGAARSAAVQRVAPELFGLPVAVPTPAEYVALGAARQAAWALATAEGDGQQQPPTWPAAQDAVIDPTDPARGADVRAAYRALRETVHPTA